MLAEYLKPHLRRIGESQKNILYEDETDIKREIEKVGGGANLGANLGPLSLAFNLSGSGIEEETAGTSILRHWWRSNGIRGGGDGRPCQGYVFSGFLGSVKMPAFYSSCL